MKRVIGYLCVFVSALMIIGAPSVFSYGGTEITIYDGLSGAAAWNSMNEDQEVENGNTTGQNWDLEGFFLDGFNLTMIGGFDFLGGEPYDVDGDGNDDLVFESGDIYIDTDGDAEYGLGITNHTWGDGWDDIHRSFGYDYVIDLDFSTPASITYNVYALIDDGTGAANSSNSVNRMPYYSGNWEAAPWQYVSGGRQIVSGGTATYATGLTDAETGFLGGTHNALTVDLSFLGASRDFTAHFTMGCGNDNLMGAATTVPEPATMVLLGIGLLGISGISRKKFKKIS